MPSLRVRRLLGLAAAALSVLPSASGWRDSALYGDGGGEAVTGVDENGKNRTDDGSRFCSWDPMVALEMAFDYPWPSGDDFPLTIPNDAVPGGDLTLTVYKDEEPYKFKVPPGGFGGRVMVCDMPKVPDDDEFAMTRARPICHVAEPAKMDCKTSDFFSTGKVRGWGRASGTSNQPLPIITIRARPLATIGYHRVGCNFYGPVS